MLSWLRDMSDEQLSHYGPEQLAKLLRQHMDVRICPRHPLSLALLAHNQQLETAISREIKQQGTNGANGSSSNQVPESKTNGSSRAPQVKNECCYTVCPRCRPGCADRASLSMDGVVNGEIPPAAAVGFGFHLMGERPVVNSEILKTIGRRTAPSVCLIVTCLRYWESRD